jgi:cytochrome c oxidase cbb3-type subunit 3
LRGIGSRYDEKTLQARIVNPRARGSGQAQPPKDVPVTAEISFRAGDKVSGRLVGISDFFVTVVDANGGQHTYLREGDQPVVELRDPLQAHMDLMRRYEDRDLHDLTAYLVALK